MKQTIKLIALQKRRQQVDTLTLPIS